MLVAPSTSMPRTRETPNTLLCPIDLWLTGRGAGIIPLLRASRAATAELKILCIGRKRLLHKVHQNGQSPDAA